MGDASEDAERRYVAWFHELDAWTEYWDVYHPETRGRFYFGNGGDEPGLLTLILPRGQRPAPFQAWTRMALGLDTGTRFVEEIHKPGVAAAIREIDDLVSGIFARHFRDARDASVQQDYLKATFRFATDTLPPAAERDARIAASDPRKATAGRHTLDGDLMWFAWALELEGAHILDDGSREALHALMLAGVAVGCSANFAWRGHRRTRAEYRADDSTARLLHDRGTVWARDLHSASEEVHALYRIREWGRA